MCKLGTFEHSSGLIEQGNLIESPLDFIIDRNFYVINGDWNGCVAYEDGDYYLYIKEKGYRRLLSPTSNDLNLVVRYESIKSEKELKLEEKYKELYHLECEIYELEREIKSEKKKATSGLDEEEDDDDIPF